MLESKQKLHPGPAPCSLDISVNSTQNASSGNSVNGTSFDSKVERERIPVFSSSIRDVFTLDKAKYTEQLCSLSEKLAEKSVLFAKRTYQGHMVHEPATPAVDGLLEALRYNPNQISPEGSGITIGFELDFIKEMKELVGYGPKSWGYISSGGTISNIEALWIAKKKARNEGNKSNIVLASSSAHYSIRKACDLLDLTFNECKVDKAGSIVLPDCLDGVLAVVVNMGSTEHGTVDDVASVLKRCHGERKIHVHADAAYGGYYLFLAKKENEQAASLQLQTSPSFSPALPSQFLLSEKTRKSLLLLWECDSISIDPHKLGYVPYSCGLFLLKNGEDRQFIDVTTGKVNYINSNVWSSCTVEGSRSGAIVTSVYFAHTQLKEMYPEIMTNLLHGSLKLKESLKVSPYFEVYEPSDLGVVLFTIKPEACSSGLATTDAVPTLEYFVDRFYNLENANRGRIQLVTTQANNKLHFRVVIMDPDFVTYCQDFVSQLEQEFQEYRAQYKQFING